MITWSRLYTVNCLKSVSNFPHMIRGLNPRPQKWEGSVLPPTSLSPVQAFLNIVINLYTIQDVFIIGKLPAGHMQKIYL